MGLNFLMKSTRRSYCLKAAATGVITLAGPFALVQGGFGLLVLNPVFLQGYAENETFGGPPGEPMGSHLFCVLSSVPTVVHVGCMRRHSRSDGLSLCGAGPYMCDPCYNASTGKCERTPLRTVLMYSTLD